jgi:hypothetical protein
LCCTAPARRAKSHRRTPLEDHGRSPLISKRCDLSDGCPGGARFLPPARTPRDGIVGDLLGELLNQHLFDRLRLHEGKTYGEAVVHSQLWGGTSVLDGHFDIEDASVVEGTSVIASCLTEGGQSLLDPASIERVRWKVALSRAAQLASNDDVMRALFEGWKLGWSPAMLDEVPDQLATVTASDLEAALRTCRASTVVSVTAAVARH